MLIKYLVDKFSKAQESGKDCLVNYVWINEFKDNDKRVPECSIPLSYIDRAYKNARRYPHAQFKIWVDYRYLDKRSVNCLSEHYKRYAPGNVILCDLSTIPAYHENSLFHPEKPRSVWARADLARVIVMHHAVQNEPQPFSIYADFDVEDVRLYEAKQKMEQYGMALGTAREFNWFFSSYEILENSYFAFPKGNQAKANLGDMLSRTLESASKDGNGFQPLLHLAREWADEKKRDLIGDLSLRGVSHCMGYEMPRNRRYTRLNWNA